MSWMRPAPARAAAPARGSSASWWRGCAAARPRRIPRSTTTCRRSRCGSRSWSQRSARRG
jgi:hypothetical protein